MSDLDTYIDRVLVENEKKGATNSNSGGHQIFSHAGGPGSASKKGKIREVQSYEGTIAVKGWKIAYKAWVPSSRLINESRSPADDLQRPLFPDDGFFKMNPLSMTSHLETAICSHGWLDNANSFTHLATGLVRALKMRVIAIDLPGHGKTSHSENGFYTKETFIIAVIRFIHAAQIRSFHLICHSLSALCLPFAVPFFPSSWQCKSLICIEQFAVTRFSPNPTRVDLSSLLDSPLESHPPKLYNSIEELVSARVHVTEAKYPGKQTISKESARTILSRNIQSIQLIDADTRQRVPKYYLRTDPLLHAGAVNSLSGFGLVLNLKDMLTKVIPRIKCPIRCIFGNDGWPGLDLVAKVMEPKMKNLKIVRLPGSHHLHLDDASTCLKVIVPFYQDIERKRKANDSKL